MFLVNLTILAKAPTSTPFSFTPIALVLLIMLCITLALLLGLSFWRQMQQETRLHSLAQQIFRIAQQLAHTEIRSTEQEGLPLLKRAYALLARDAIRQMQRLEAQATPPSPPSTDSSIPQRPATQKPQSPSKLAAALIDLRDRFLMARPKDDDAQMSVEILDIFYQELGNILAHEHITTLQETGHPLDLDTQHIIDTQPTSDPSLDGIVWQCESPGYLFYNQLFRVQEVVIYKYREPFPSHSRRNYSKS